ncbi:hypothetical protein Vi05172_g12403 [Venturia inaequalis]|nr:hypothetical protein Vi05172_g12403 [Venturia inaequalis]
MKISQKTPMLIAAWLSQAHAEIYQPTQPQLWSAPNTTSLLDTILSRGYLKVGTTGDYKPFSYSITNTTRFPSSNTTNSTLTPSSFNTSYIGADIDAAQALSNALNLPHPVKFVPTIWANLTKDVNAGKFDIAMGGITITLERAKTVFFSTATQRTGKVACIRCSDASKFTSLDSLDREGVVVVVNPGGTNEKFDRANLSRATIKVVDDNNAVFRAVLDGEGDAMITDSIEVELQMKLHPNKLCMVSGSDGLPFDFSQLGYLLPRDNPWKNFVDIFVGIQSGSGNWNTTLTRWMEFGWPTV